jgi:Sec-independent protein translocase protein TatA
LPGHIWIILILIVLVVLLVAGPRLLPKLGSRVGRLARETKEGAVEGTANLAAEARKRPEPTPSEESPEPDPKSSV